MGTNHAKTRSKKGVVYTKTDNEIVDCLFCRIARGESPPNALWYSDDKCSVFIPRGPAARLHLLVVPLEHIQNISTLTEEHRPLLEHMKKVAIEQLRVHSQRIGSTKFPLLLPRAPPPSHYLFNRGNLLSLSTSTDTPKDDDTSMDSSFVFCFHRPPYNSIDHLHLHAIQKPFQNLRNYIMFAPKSPWHGSLEHVLRDLPSAKAKL
ncbi:unnamed protein product [Adineta steineri]|uniref:Adenosine 5'-monophosphoramidase HINT3 n=1 Tax=Adineta steineri TaxID=433720 RepID=A0A815DT00_9BILA|nr:unnamed protein product [Adineta steineri]CAF1300957.1 unnamed protein product [Adineta steineri]